MIFYLYVVCKANSLQSEQFAKRTVCKANSISNIFNSILDAKSSGAKSADTKILIMYMFFVVDNILYNLINKNKSIHGGIA